VAYEGQRTAEDQQVTQEVPLAAFAVILLRELERGTTTLNPTQIASMDPYCAEDGSCPLGPRRLAAEAIMRSFQLPTERS